MDVLCTRTSFRPLRGWHSQHNTLRIRAMDRRTFLGSAGAAAVASAFGLSRGASAQQPTMMKPKRLSAGDTVALVAPASATFKTVDLADRPRVAGSAWTEGQVRRAPARSSRVPGRQGQGPRGRHQRVLCRPVGARRPADPRRLGQQPAAAASRLRPDPAQPEDRPRLQRHHRAAARHPCEDRPRDVSRAERRWAAGMR